MVLFNGKDHIGIGIKFHISSSEGLKKSLMVRGGPLLEYFDGDGSHGVDP